MLARDTAFRHLGPLWPCPLHHTQGWGGPFYLSCSSRQPSPKACCLHGLQAAESNLFFVGRGGWGRGVLLLGLLAPIFLSGCAAPPRLVQGDSTNNSWYAKMQLTKF
jgi:hypothetical protein